MTFIPCSLNSCRMAYDVCAERPCRERCRAYQAQRMAFGRIAEDLKALEEYKVEIPKTSFV